MLPFWNLQKITIFFKIAKSTLIGFLKCPEIFFDMVSVKLQMNEMRKSEVKTNKDG